MANIFKTTLKKDVIADIANNNVREIRFPITKFWATRLADEYNLDEKEFTLTPDNLVICDGNKPVALAGIMGGLNSEILDTTEEVMFECAKFARDNIRKSSRAHGQITDASSRYSKGVDEYSTVMAIK